MGEHAVGRSSRSTEDTAFPQDSARGCRIPEQPLISLMSFDKTVAHPIAGSPGMAQTTAFEEAANLCGLRAPPATLSRSECGRVSCGYCCFLLNDA
jgi:hypothetical protein